MKTETEKVLPKTMIGTVHAQFVKCGKLNCKCTRGELHGAYFYYFVRVGGRLRKRYLKASEVQEIQTACLARQVQKKQEIETTKQTWLAFRILREELRTAGSIFNF